MARYLVAPCSLLFALLAFALPVAAQGRISMSASSNRVAVGEPFAVEIRIELDGEEPDAVELPDFGSLEVLGRHQSRPTSVSFSLGSGGPRTVMKSEIIDVFTLRAPSRGAFTIPPAVLVVKKRRLASQSLNILAIDGGQGAPSGSALTGPNADPPAGPGDMPTPPGGLDGATFDQTMFLRTVVDKKRAYIGEQVTITVYLYLRGQLPDSPSITREPTLEGFWSNDLLAMQRSLAPVRQEVNGRAYNAYVLRRFAAFPLRAGKLEVGAPAVEVASGGSIFDMLNGAPQTVRRNGVTVSIEAVPPPPQPTRGAPIHTGTLTLEAGLDPADAKVGDAVTLRLTMKGSGNLRALTLPAPKIAGVEALPPELDDQVTSELDQIGGERVARWLLLPRTAGTHTVPSFAVDVLDAASGKYTTVRTSPLTLTVTGQSEAPPTAAAKTATPDVSAPRFGPARTESALRRKAPELREQAWFWPSVLAAPLSLLLLSGVRLAGRARARRRNQNRDVVAMREVDDRLDKAAKIAASGDARAALGLLGGAIKGVLAARLDEPVGGLTLSALETDLRARGMEDKLIGRVIGQLGALESARFDPTAQGAVQVSRAIDGVRALVTELGRFRPKPLPAARRRADDGRESRTGEHRTS